MRMTRAARRSIGHQRGFTLMEMLVGLGLFSIIGLGMGKFLTQTFRRVGSENRSAIASMELRSALNLLASELRMGGAVSPYLPGIDPTLVTCTASISVTTTSVRFLVVHDEASSASGLRAYYVGYRYDPLTKQLLRGEVASTSTMACVVPATDPTLSPTAQILAENVEAVDFDNNGTNESVFAYTAPTLTVTLGAVVDTREGTLAAPNKITQKVRTQIFVRSI